ncbi:MAG TPA: glycosyltransferase family 2 protein [Sumerlaeia bacterium]|nr:glycosyltransferase family 2 protein [Sumerlaeia bacterium]
MSETPGPVGSVAAPRRAGRGQVAMSGTAARAATSDGGSRSGGDRRLLVLVPAFDEERNIGRVVRGIHENVGDKGDVLVVDDGSSDDTADEARAAGATVLSLPFNLGYGAALKAGYQYALRRDYDAVLQMDADGQHDPSSIPALLGPLFEGRAKVIIGSRYLGRATYDVPLARRAGQRLFAGILSFLTGERVTDPTSGFQALDRDVLRLYVSEEFPSDYPDADVLLLLHYRGIEFREAPAVFHGPSRAVSMHAGWRPYYYVCKMLLSMFLIACRHVGRGTAANKFAAANGFVTADKPAAAEESRTADETATADESPEARSGSPRRRTPGAAATGERARKGAPR